MTCHVISRLALLHKLDTYSHSMSCHLTSSHVLSRLVISCHVMSRLVMSCHVISRLLNSSIMAAGWPRRGFRNRGPVRESGSERRSRCGAACTASVRVWRRAHFCDLGIVLRGRLRGSGVLRACRGHAAGTPRRCAVGIGFGACFVHAWSTCVSRGRLRGSCVLGACWERAGGPCRRRCAVGIGFGVCRAHA